MGLFDHRSSRVVERIAEAENPRQRLPWPRQWSGEHGLRLTSCAEAGGMEKTLAVWQDALLLLYPQLASDVRQQHARASAHTNGPAERTGLARAFAHT